MGSDSKWRFEDSTEDSPVDFAQPDFDDSSWGDVELLVPPARNVRRFRQRFDTHASASGRRTWLVFDRACSDANVWIDGNYLGDIDGVALPTSFEVTDQVLASDHHVLALQIPSTSSSSHEQSTVSLEETGSVRISRFRALCTDAATEQATVSISLELDARGPVYALVKTSVAGKVLQESRRNLASGRNRSQWTVSIDKPELWWPKGLGTPHLTEVTVDIVDASRPAESSDSRTLSMGLRDVTSHRKALLVNDSRVFLRACFASDLESIDPASSGITAIFCDDISTAERALSFADEEGLLALYPVPREQKEARQLTEALGHHASLVAWSDERSHNSLLSRRDRSAKTITKSDPTRPLVAPLPVVSTMSKVDNLRRSRHMRGYVLASGNAELLAGVAEPVRATFSARRAAQRNNVQLVDVHLVNDTATDRRCKVNATANWPGHEPLSLDRTAEASAGSTSYVGTIVVPRGLAAETIELRWALATDDATLRGAVIRKVGSDGMIQGVVSSEVPRAARSDLPGRHTADSQDQRTE